MKRSIIMLAMAASLLSAPSLANSFSIDTLNRGWIRSDGWFSTNSNYLVGNGVFGDFNGEYRNYFIFALPTFQGTVTSATLTLAGGQILAAQNPSVTYQLTSLDEFPDNNMNVLGVGTPYASVTDLAANFLPSRSITLNADALAAITSGGFFGLSGRLVGDIAFGGGQPAQYLFGFTNSIGSATLTFTTATDTGVPEPASWAMLIAGFGLTGAAMRRRRSAITA